MLLLLLLLLLAAGYNESGRWALSLVRGIGQRAVDPGARLLALRVGSVGVWHEAIAQCENTAGEHHCITSTVQDTQKETEIRA